MQWHPLRYNCGCWDTDWWWDHFVSANEYQYRILNAFIDHWRCYYQNKLIHHFHHSKLKILIQFLIQVQRHKLWHNSRCCDTDGWLDYCIRSNEYQHRTLLFIIVVATTKTNSLIIFIIRTYRYWYNFSFKCNGIHYSITEDVAILIGVGIVVCVLMNISSDYLILSLIIDVATTKKKSFIIVTNYWINLVMRSPAATLDQPDSGAVSQTDNDKESTRAYGSKR